MSNTNIDTAPEFAERLHQEVLARSATDYDFRQTLIANPAAAIEAHALQNHGVTISELPVNVRFVEPAGDVTYVLPKLTDAGDAELSEADLEAVAGGASPLIIGTYFAGVATAGAIYAGVKYINSQFPDADGASE